MAHSAGKTCYLPWSVQLTGPTCTCSVLDEPSREHILTLLPSVATGTHPLRSRCDYMLKADLLHHDYTQRC